MTQPQASKKTKKEQETYKSAITSGHINAPLWKLALPTWGTVVFMNLMGIVDMFFVGKVGHEALAAVTLGSIMIGVIVMFALGLEAGATTLVANAVGRGDRPHAGVVTAQGMLIAIVMAAVVAATTIPFAPEIIKLLGGTEDVVNKGAIYLRIVAGGSIGVLMEISLSAALRGSWKQIGLRYKKEATAET